MLKWIVTFAVSLLLVVGVAGTADARVKRVSPADRAGGKSVVYVEPLKRTRDGEPRLLRVTFKDGSVWKFTRCKREDSRNCFWAAEFRGNGYGKSFVNLHGRYVYIPVRMSYPRWMTRFR